METTKVIKDKGKPFNLNRKLLEEPTVTVAEAPPSNFTDRVVVTEQIGDSMDSLDSVQPEEAEPEVVRPSSPGVEVVASSAPAAFNIANSPLDVNQTVEPDATAEETEDRKSISSNIN